MRRKDCAVGRETDSVSELLYGLSNDLWSIKSEVDSKLRAHSMQNLLSSTSSHNRIMGISVLISEQGTGNRREKEKRIARVEEFEEFLGQL